MIIIVAKINVGMKICISLGKKYYRRLFLLLLHELFFYDFQLHKKNHFAKVFKNLIGYVSENYDLVSLTF